MSSPLTRINRMQRAVRAGFKASNFLRLIAARAGEMPLPSLGGNMVDRRGKLALFIDAVKLHATAKALGFEIDYKKLLEVFKERGILLRAFYYTTVMDDLEYCAVRPLVDWLDYNGYMVVTKPIKEFVDDGGRRKFKTNMDIDLVVGAMETADHADEIVLFSGDGSLSPLIAALQRRGVRASLFPRPRANHP